MIHVIARIEVKEGKLDEFLAIFKANIPNVIAEKGCHGYTPCLDVATGLPPQVNYNAGCVTILECWETREHLAAHLATPHMIRYGEAVKELVKNMELTVVTPA